MTSLPSGDSFLPGGANTLPGFDPGYETYSKKRDQVISVPTVGDVTVHASSTLKVYRLNAEPGYSGSTTPNESDDCSDDIEDLEAPIASGEILYFEVTLAVSGLPDSNIGLCIHTPPGPTGGFHVLGQSALGTVQGGSFGGDSFNNPAGVVKAGVTGTLDSWSVIRARGMVGNGPQGGLLRLQLGPAEEVAGLLLAIHRSPTGAPSIVHYINGAFTAYNNPPGLESNGGWGLYATVAKVGDYHWITALDASNNLSLYRSSDQGQTWTLSFSNVSFSFNVGIPAVGSDGTFWLERQNRLVGSNNDSIEVWKSTDDGDSWVLNQTLVTNAHGDGAWGIAVDPTDASRVVALVYDDRTGVADSAVKIFITENGGSSWTSFTLDPTAANVTGGTNIGFEADGTFHVVFEDDPGVGDYKLIHYYSSTPASSASYASNLLDTNTDGWGFDFVNGALQITETKLVATFTPSSSFDTHAYGSSNGGDTWVQFPTLLPASSNFTNSNAYYVETDDVLYNLITGPNGLQFHRLVDAFNGGTTWEDITGDLATHLGYTIADADAWWGISITAL